MFLSEYFYISIILLLFVLLCISAKKLYTFSMIILNLEESIEDSLDLLNHHYSKMNEVIQKPVFFDSIEVRQVLNDIKQCHFAILKIANKLTSDSGMQGEIKEENTKDKK